MVNLFNVKAMSKTFRGRFIALLKEQLPEEMTKQLVNALYKHNWVVYAKQPFRGPQSAVGYLGRYTHKIAISNHRIQNFENGKVNFSYKDYKHGSIKKQMPLEAMEFIRRFSLHILPRGFVRIRHYGICSSSSKIKSALVIKAQLPQMAKSFEVVAKAAPEPYNPLRCPCCKKETMETLMRFNRRGPPANWKKLAADLLEGMKALEVTVE